MTTWSEDNDQTAGTKSVSCKDSLGKLALCCLWILEPDTCSAIPCFSQVLAEGLGHCYYDVKGFPYNSVLGQQLGIICYD